jgi:Matrixin
LYVAPADVVRSVLAQAAGLVTILLATSAGAFCRTTTCDPKLEHCATEQGCNVDGHPLYWQEKCISFATQKDGSLRRTSFEPNGISYEVADRAFRLAFSSWTSANCGGKPPSFKMWDVGPVECNEPEFNDLLPNANVWMFRDDKWPYEDQGQTLALTTVLFEKSTGVILDADVEINAFNPKQTLSTSDPPAEIGQDLQAIATHEAGHFLGLSHSKEPTATMNTLYHVGDLDYRSPHKDDIAGICEIYPADRDAPDCRGPHPPHGFSRYCGGGKPADVSSCSLHGGRNIEPSRGQALALFIGGIAALALRRGRRRG